MRKIRLNAIALSLALVASGCMVAAAQNLVTNGDFTPPANSSSNTTSYQGSNGGVNLPPGEASVNWYQAPGTVGSAETASFGMDPANFSWTFTATSGSGWINAGVAENGSAYGFSAPPNDYQSNTVTQIAFLQSSNYLGGSGGAISQTVDLTGGYLNQYMISFDLDNRQANGATQVPVTITIGGVVFQPVAGASDGDWTAYSGTFTGSGDEILKFAVPGTGYSDSTAGLADVAIIPVPTEMSPPTGNLVVPEGGAGWMYILLAAAACFGAMVHGSRNLLESRVKA
jgi:hypothetical protein